jgi:hypothetical protein
MTMVLPDRPRVVVAAASRRRSMLPLFLAGMLVITGLAVSTVVAAPRAASFASATPHAVGAPWVTVPEYGRKGAYVLGYVHGAQVELTVPITNTGRLPLTVTSVALGGGPAPLVAVRRVTGLPLTLWPGRTGHVTLRAELTNCRYYHERAMETFGGVTVTFRSLLRSCQDTVAFDRPIMVKGPMLVGCPGRKLDRSAVNRSDLL